MKHSALLIYSFIVIFFVLPMFAKAALTIDVTAEDLTDTTAGEDLWRYGYRVGDTEGFLDNAFEGFTVLFNYNLYGKLSSPNVGNAYWDLLTIDPDNSIPDDGIFDALTFVDDASLADIFTVDFVWLGMGVPHGNQAFETYLCNDGPDCFDVTVTGSDLTGSTSAVPLPAPIALMAVGIATMLVWGRAWRA